jgi:hypothetical protein
MGRGWEGGQQQRKYGTSRHNTNERSKKGEGDDDNGWVQRIDTVVWEQYTSDTRYRQIYDTHTLTHLLRFIRNVSQHPPPAGSAAKTVFVAEGGVTSCFLSRFPRLLIVVWRAVGAAGWGGQQEFSDFLPQPVDDVVIGSDGGGRGSAPVVAASRAHPE